MVSTPAKNTAAPVASTKTIAQPPKSESENAKSDLDPAERIEAAIERGVPIFNGGDHAKCAEIYKTTIQSLAADERVCSTVRKTMKMVLDRAAKVDGARDLAWIYRHGLDHAYQSVSN